MFTVLFAVLVKVIGVLLFIVGPIGLIWEVVKYTFDIGKKGKED